jgi:glycosyltransferase involved in cell wall biosynthesis
VAQLKWDSSAQRRDRGRTQSASPEIGTFHRLVKGSLASHTTGCVASPVAARIHALVPRFAATFPRNVFLAIGSAEERSATVNELRKESHAPALAESSTCMSPSPRHASRTRPLRVGIVTDGLVERTVGGEPAIANGGVGVYIYNLVRQLQRLPSRVQCVLIRVGRGHLDIYTDGRSENIFLPRGSARGVGSLLGLSHASVAARCELDLIHYPNQFGGAWLPKRVRRVVTLHDITPLLFPAHHPWTRTLGYRLLMRRSLKAADKVIVDSMHTQNDVLAHCLVPESRLAVVPLAAAERFHPRAAATDLVSRYDLPPRFILSVGVFEPRKNHALLVAALQRLHAEGERIGLVLVGRDGWRWTDPLASTAGAALHPWIRILRNLPDHDLPELYARAEVFAYPSFYEGFGLPVLEAMACGTPVICSDTSSLPEVAADAALLVDPNDADALTAHLRAVLHDPVLHQRLVTSGVRRARQFSWQLTAERTLAVYEEVCGQRG